MTTRSTWKRAERMIANFFGTERTPLSGGCSKHTRSDTLHKKLFIEVKYRIRHTVITLMEKIEIFAKAEDKIPILVLKTKSSSKTYLVLEINDLLKIAEILKESK